MKCVMMLASLFLLLPACSTDPEKTYPVQVMRGGQAAKKKLTQVEIQNLKKALELFKFDVGRYPTTEEGLQALIKNPGLPGWRQHLFNPAAIRGLKYESDGTSFQIEPAA